MHSEGNESVLGRLLEKKRLRACDDERHKDVRGLLLILTGGMRGAYGGGQVIALEKAGLTEEFDTVVGISTGSPTGAYFLSGQAEIGTSIYCVECTQPRFIDLARLRMDADYLAGVFYEGGKKLDTDAVRASRSNFFIGVTCARTGSGSLIDAKRMPDMVRAIRASIAMPLLTGKPVHLEGGSFLDGGGAYPFPLEEAITRFSPTDVLVLANGSPEGYARTRPKAVRNWLGTLGYPKSVREAFVSAPRRFERARDAMATAPCRVLVLWSDDCLSSFERNPKKLSEAAQASERHLTGLLSKFT